MFGRLGLPELIIIAAFIGLIVLALRKRSRASVPLYCPNCGSVAAPKKHTKGSFAVEVVLWLCFIAPGLIYSVWRLASKEIVCPSCGAPNMIPADSPKARAALAK